MSYVFQVINSCLHRSQFTKYNVANWPPALALMTALTISLCMRNTMPCLYLTSSSQSPQVLSICPTSVPRRPTHGTVMAYVGVLSLCPLLECADASHTNGCYFSHLCIYFGSISTFFAIVTIEPVGSERASTVPA